MTKPDVAPDALPAAWYTDLAVLAEERQRIFRRTWQYVGRSEQLAVQGDYLTAEVDDLPVVVVVGETGLRAFLNVCRHRRHPVVSGAGNRKSLQCPYHAWTYDLNGCLKAAPCSDREEGFRTEDFPLPPLRVETWGRFVFVNADPDAPPLTQFLGELPRMIAPNGLDLAELQFRKREVWTAAANWKVMLENYLECYHCPVAHPAFSAAVDVNPDAYILRPFEWFSSQQAPVLSGGNSADRAQYYFLWPNFTINIDPGPPNLSVDAWFPAGVERTRGFTDYFFGPDVPAAAAEEWMAFSKQVRTEDDALTAAVQRGLRAGALAAGRLLPKSERLILHFQSLVRAALS
jgi:choline monooxygenase